MKMRKLLASAVAASVAVTSLATVASAAEKTWSMGHTTGTIELTSTKGVELGDKYYLTDEEFNAGTKTLGVSADRIVLVVNSSANDAEMITGLTLKVTGVKGTRGAASKTYSYAFTNHKSTVCNDSDRDYDNKSKYWCLNVYEGTAPVDGFLPEQFLEITKLELEATATTTVSTAAAYDAWGSSTWGSYNGATYNTAEVEFFDWTGVLSEVNNLVYGAWGFNYAGNKSTSVEYPFMPVTAIDSDDILGRSEIDVLSYTYAYGSDGLDWESDSSNQSFNGDDTTAGTVANDFAGLASQAADFFNKQTNGTITFKFTTTTSAGGTAWENGGIPSTQTGIKNFMGDASANDFALFFNYSQTGSLQAITELDADAGTVTFDISNILDAMGGQTLGTLNNIYYGLRKGLSYEGKSEKGLMVESVTFAYDEDADVEADIEDEEEDVEIEEDDDVEIEEDDDVEIEEEDDDVAVEDDAETDGDVIVETEDDDANPGTGVALAVVPAMVAAAAVVLSKKRK